MNALIHIKGPSRAGPGDWHLIEQAVASHAGDGESIRIDVGDLSGDALGAELERAIPALQSGSLFGDTTTVIVLHADKLPVSEADWLAELAIGLDGQTSQLILATAGALSKPLASAISRHGTVETVAAVRERQASDWLGKAIKERGLKARPDGRDALLRRFGTDLPALSGALDQLAASGDVIDSQTVLARFRNRPDEPMWHFLDAVTAGDVGEALRRLSDFWTHGHPLQLLGFLESDLRQRAHAAAAANTQELAERMGRKPEDFRVKKMWRERGSVSDGDLRRALDGLARADRVLKTEPEDVHRVTMERLTVALCRWYRKPGTR